MKTLASEALMTLAQTVMKNPSHPPAEIALLAVMLAHAAWNKANGLGDPPPRFFKGLARIERSQPRIWEHFTVSSARSAIESMALAKRRLFPNDHREIIFASMTPEGTVRAGWQEVGSA
jgi:hypothetical protein